MQIITNLVIFGLAVLAQSTPVTPVEKRDSYQQDMLDSHNFFRRQHGANDLSWNNDAARYANDYAQRCIFDHTGGPYGENLFAGLDLIDAVNGWGLERKDYDFNNPEFYQNTGHFTQVVWKGTSSVGCATVYCDNLGKYTICEYSGAGNIVGNSGQYFRDNVPRQIQGSPSDKYQKGNGGGGNNPDDYQVYVCKDADFSGGCYGARRTYGQCTNMRGDYNDVVSSLGGDLRTSCKAFSDANCQGRVLDIGKGQLMNYVGGAMNDVISSVYC